MTNNLPLIQDTLPRPVILPVESDLLVFENIIGLLHCKYKKQVAGRSPTKYAV